MAPAPDDVDLAPLTQLRELQGPEDPHLVVELIDSFLARAPEALDQLGARVAAGETSGAEHEAHRLRGMCGTLGLVGMEEVCEGLENRARKGSLDGAAEEKPPFFVLLHCIGVRTAIRPSAARSSPIPISSPK